MQMVTIDKAVVQQALAALVRSEVMYGQPSFGIQENLREALAQHPVQQEPVAWALQFGDDVRICLSTVFDTRDEAQDYASSCIDKTELTPLYTSPQAAQPLSEEEIQQLKLDCGYDYYSSYEVSAAFIHGVKECEAAHGITKENQ